MKLFDPDPNLVWLFWPTHPDDELATAGWIAHLAHLGIEVHLAWTHDTPVRRAEALNAATLLGVPEERTYFHGATDGKAYAEFEELARRFSETVARVKPDRVVCGAFEQGHIDHDATNFLLNQVCDRPILEAPYYHTYLTRMPVINRFADPEGQELWELEEGDRKVKKQVLNAYPSQAIKKNLIFAEIRARVTGQGHLMSPERLRLQVHKDFLEPNLPQRLRERVMATEQWANWREAVIRWQQRNTS